MEKYASFAARSEPFVERKRGIIFVAPKDRFNDERRSTGKTPNASQFSTVAAFRATYVNIITGMRDDCKDFVGFFSHF
jgi:hypothetical protein